MAKTFASQGDLKEQKVRFDKLAEGVYAYTAEGDPNAGVVVGEDGVMVIEALATPFQAKRLLRCIRGVTAKPVKYLVLSHYHAVRVLGASAYKAKEIIASRGTYELIKERGAQDFKSEAQRFPRLFQKIDTVPGLTWPTITFDTGMTVHLGKREIRVMHLGRGHTKGDTVVWLPKEKVLFSGDLIERHAAPYCGDAYLTEWPETLEKVRALGARKAVPGRGPALKSSAEVNAGIDGTQAFLRTLVGAVRDGAAAQEPLKAVFDRTYATLQPKYGDWAIFEHCIPFNVSRAYDEMSGIADPRIWTAKRDLEMWKALQG
ncbi:MAG TPA: MBL fold metallo-hydrolase [Alphaproteobacteria bacterium]|nr:MBL fold metallo-hydrolase [Alphaproteobacteria bacterium]